MKGMEDSPLKELNEMDGRKLSDTIQDGYKGAPGIEWELLDCEKENKNYKQ